MKTRRYAISPLIQVKLNSNLVHLFSLGTSSKLENPPRSKKALEQRLIEFEGYWQAQLGTIHPKGLNIRNELKRSYYKYNASF